MIVHFHGRKREKLTYCSAPTTQFAHSTDFRLVPYYILLTIVVTELQANIVMVAYRNRECNYYFYEYPYLDEVLTKRRIKLKMIKDDKNIRIRLTECYRIKFSSICNGMYKSIQEKPQKRVNKKKTNQIDVYHLKNERNNYQTIVLNNSI